MATDDSDSFSEIVHIVREGCKVSHKQLSRDSGSEIDSLNKLFICTEHSDMIKNKSSMYLQYNEATDTLILLPGSDCVFKFECCCNILVRNSKPNCGGQEMHHTFTPLSTDFVSFIDVRPLTSTLIEHPGLLIYAEVIQCSSESQSKWITLSMRNQGSRELRFEKVSSVPFAYVILMNTFAHHHSNLPICVSSTPMPDKQIEQIAHNAREMQLLFDISEAAKADREAEPPSAKAPSPAPPIPPVAVSNLDTVVKTSAVASQDVVDIAAAQQPIKKAVSRSKGNNI